MRSLSEISSQSQDIKMNMDGMLSILGNSKDSVRSVLLNHIDTLEKEYIETKKVVDDYGNVCKSEEFMRKMFSDSDILKFISGYAKVDVTPDLIANALRNINNEKNSASKKELCMPSNNSNQVSTVKLREMMGGTSFDYDSALESAPVKSVSNNHRQSTKSDHFEVTYSNSTGTYSIKRDGSKNLEGENVFTLFDYYNNARFLNSKGWYEQIITLGINVLSLNGFPNKKGIFVTDRFKTDRISCISTSGYKGNCMYPLDETKYSQSSLYVTNRVLLKEFLAILCEMGYADDLFDFFSGLVQKVKSDSKSEDNDFLKYIEFTSNKPKFNKRVLLSVNGRGTLCYDNSIKPSKHEVFRLMKLALECICQVNPELELNILMKYVKFYGGYDIVAQGKSGIKFIDKGIDFVKSSTCNYKLVPFSESKDMCSANSKPSLFKLNYNDMKYTIRPKYRTQTSKNSCFTGEGLLYAIMEIFIKNGVSLEDMISVDRYLLKKEGVHTEPRGNLLHIDLGDGRYYYVNKCNGWVAPINSIVKLFEELHLDLNDLELCFDK